MYDTVEIIQLFSNDVNFRHIGGSPLKTTDVRVTFYEDSGSLEGFACWIPPIVLKTKH